MFIRLKEGGGIERFVILRLPTQDNGIFKKIKQLSKQHPELQVLEMEALPALTFQALEIDVSRRRVFYGRQEVTLTPKEYALLFLLAANAGKVLTYQKLYEAVWSDDSLGNEINAVSCHIYGLRKKFRRISPKPSFTIRCVREVGFRFEDAEEK